MEKSSAMRYQDATTERKYRVVCYMRIDPDEIVPLSYDYALMVKNQLELMQPENIYRIEKIEAVES